MGLVDHTQSFQVEFSVADTFNALKSAMSKVDGFKIDKVDEALNTIYLKAGVSMFSWGENIIVSVEKAHPIGAVISVLSTPKTGVMFGGSMDMGKNRKNISAISDALSLELKNYTHEENVQKGNLSSAEEIEKFALLMEKGVISEDEFMHKKKQLLGL